MGRGERIILVVTLTIILLFMGCQSVPEEITGKPTPNEKEGIVKPNEKNNGSYSYPTYPRGENASIADEKDSMVYIPHRVEQIEHTIKIYDSSVKISADAHIPELDNLPILEVEYIPPIDDELLQALIVELFEEPSKVKPLSEEKARFYNPNSFKVFEDENMLMVLTIDYFSLNCSYKKSQNERWDSVNIDQATKLICDRLNNIFQEIDVWPNPSISLDDGNDFEIYLSQCIWGMPMAYGNAYIDGSAENSTYMFGSVASQDHRIPGDEYNEECTYSTGDIIDFGITKPIKVISVYKSDCKLQPLGDVLEYIGQGTNGRKLFPSVDIGPITGIQMVYVPESSKEVESGLILKPYWEFSHIYDNSLHVYRYSALAEDYE